MVVKLSEKSQTAELRMQHMPSTNTNIHHQHTSPSSHHPHPKSSNPPPNHPTSPAPGMKFTDDYAGSPSPRKAAPTPPYSALLSLAANTQPSQGCTLPTVQCSSLPDSQHPALARLHPPHRTVLFSL
jgi:hypothetical protein